MTPPIDTCAGTQYDCPNTRVCINYGTIMSYCHTCSGGVANIRMEFHARSINERMLPYLSGITCNLAVACNAAGDCDGNGSVNTGDISCFTEVLTVANPDPVESIRCDLNGDGKQDGRDIPLMVQAVLDGP
jgi:hypothetical protein